MIRAFKQRPSAFPWLSHRDTVSDSERHSAGFYSLTHAPHLAGLSLCTCVSITPWKQDAGWAKAGENKGDKKRKRWKGRVKPTVTQCLKKKKSQTFKQHREVSWSAESWRSKTGDFNMEWLSSWNNCDLLLPPLHAVTVAGNVPVITSCKTLHPIHYLWWTTRGIFFENCFCHCSSNYLHQTRRHFKSLQGFCQRWVSTGWLSQLRHIALVYLKGVHQTLT